MKLVGRPNIGPQFKKLETLDRLWLSGIPHWVTTKEASKFWHVSPVTAYRRLVLLRATGKIKRYYKPTQERGFWGKVNIK